MAFYVTIQDGGRTLLALGPFNTHGDALRHVAPVRALVRKRGYREGDWCAYGTSRLKTRREPGKFNGQLEEPEGRWLPGDIQDPVAYYERHATAADVKRMRRHLERSCPAR